MTKSIPLLFLAAGLCAGLHAGEPVSLFDGKTFQGWTGQDGKEPGAGWRVVDGTLHLDGAGGNLLSEKEYTDFDLTWEWKIAEGGNNGLKYWVTKVDEKHWLGIEYQMLDDEKHPDSKNGPKRITASFYDIQAPTVKPPVKAPGEWNQSRVVAKDGKLQHWLNGVLVGEADTASPEWKANLAASKFKDKVGFAPGTGRIMLTDHKDKTWYRNIRITEL
ncbi:MAG: DUF1080 domain-containing protein [Verrucomicrobiaceae bacterium]|nr:DUF1080 domain-containing protein [Verrucomicrobiaceae bacterium]